MSFENPEIKNNIFKPEPDKNDQENLSVPKNEAELKFEGEKIYFEEFANKLGDILEHDFGVKSEDGQEESIVLKGIVDKYLEEFSSPEFSGLSIEKKVEKQKEFVKDLGRAINKIPAKDPWSFYFKRIMETGKINCSGSTALLGMTLESTKEKTGIKNIEWGNPFGHAVNMITFGDGRLYWADARNGIFEDISDYVKSEIKGGLKFYKIKEPAEKNGYQIDYRIIPTTSIKEGAISNYLSNLSSAYDAAEGKFDDALKMSRTKKEMNEVQKMAGDVCRDRDLSSLKRPRLSEVDNFFTEKLQEYEKSKEFEKEKERIKKIIENS